MDHHGLFRVSVVWCGVVWSGVVWSGVVWCGVGVVWSVFQCPVTALSTIRIMTPLTYADSTLVDGWVPVQSRALRRLLPLLPATRSRC